MDAKFCEVLNECAKQVLSGKRIVDCSKQYPEHAKELEVLLLAFLSTEQVLNIIPTQYNN